MSPLPVAKCRGSWVRVVLPVGDTSGCPPEIKARNNFCRFSLGEEVRVSSGTASGSGSEFCGGGDAGVDFWF